METIENRPTFSYILEDAAIDNGEEDDSILLKTAEWAAGYLKKNSVHVAEETDKNQMTLSVLRLTKFLVLSGYVREEERVKDLFRILMMVLDGKTDVLMLGFTEDERAKTPWALKNRFEFNEMTQPIIYSKIEICLIMEKLVQLRLEMRFATKRRHKRRAVKQSQDNNEIKYDIKTLKILEWLVTEEINQVDEIDRTKYPDKWAKAEMRKGCSQNQVTIFQSKVVHAVNYIWVQSYADCPEDQVLELKGKAALCLLSLLEDDSDEDTRAVFKQMAAMFDLRALLSNLNDVHKLVTTADEEKRRKFQTQIDNMARKETIFKLIHYLFHQGKEISKEFVNEMLYRWKLKEAKSQDQITFVDKHPASLTKSNIPAIRDSNFELDSVEIKKGQSDSESEETKPLLKTDPEIVHHIRDSEADMTKNLQKVIDEIKKEEEDSTESEDDEGTSPKETGFIYSMLIATLLPYMSIENQELCERSVAFNVFNNKTGRIEIVRESNTTADKRLYTVLFPIPEICFYIKDYTKDRFLWMRKRNTPQEKVEDFINQSQDIIYEIKNQARVEGEFV
ncbi:Inositol 1,4,5-trisphosphate receptor type 2 [Rhizoclosmatium hyalinum]|nr:Inositol 1,4,5-trisphosphate receptor type 2 [Rhizoclosmatium hyalinum]